MRTYLEWVGVNADGSHPAHGVARWLARGHCWTFLRLMKFVHHEGCPVHGVGLEGNSCSCVRAWDLSRVGAEPELLFQKVSLDVFDKVRVLPGTRLQKQLLGFSMRTALRIERNLWNMKHDHVLPVDGEPPDLISCCVLCGDLDRTCAQHLGELREVHRVS